MDKELTKKALLQAVPYVGGSLATLYFGAKEKKQFERLKEFYEELNVEVESIKSSISPIEEHSQEELAALIEEIHEKVENERVESKKKYYQNLYKKSLIHPVKGNFNERKYFLDLISQLTELHFSILALLIKQNKKVPINAINANGVDPSLKKGFVQQLENYGLLDSELESIQFTTQAGSINKKVEITELGKSFHYFCLED